MKGRQLAICLALAAVTLALYWPITGNGFVSLDDHDYIIDNAHVNRGLSWSGILWAFGSSYASNWHPLTWISHMLDCQLFGLRPGLHHLVSLLLHTANSVLLLILLNRLTGAFWRSAVIAALFAWHPVHVESVAWASERKDVLSTLFWLLTMLAYASYVREAKVQSPKSRGFYTLALGCFALGLMSKAMLVTLPFALLLLDFWPLKRGLESEAEASVTSMPWRRLVFEKLPFFLLALIASAVTFIVQQTAGAVSSLEDLPFALRAGNAALSYVRYISKMVWPADLAAFYPYSKNEALAPVITSLLLLVLLSALFVLAARWRPYLVTGWFWYLGTLVPTIGLVQVGSQSMADRYTYIPSIGFFIIVVWGLADLLSASPAKWVTNLAAAGTALALAGCMVCTWFQAQYWHDSKALFQHAIDATGDNYTAENGLGGALDSAGRTEEAMIHYSRSVELQPRYPEGQYNLGTALLDRGQVDQAIEHLNAALERNPNYAMAHCNLGKALLMQGKVDEARSHFLRAIELKPDFAPAHYNLGTMMLMQSKVDEAIAQFYEATRLKPDYPEARGNLGAALMRAGKSVEGIAQFSAVVQEKPNDPGARLNLGLAYLEHGQLDDAATQFSEALKLNSQDARAHYELAFTRARQHRTKEAVGQYREVLRLKPDSIEGLNNLAWILATSPEPDARDGKEAVRLARKACELTASKQAGPVLTLAAALAEAGQFEEAVSAAQQARELADSAADRDLSAKSGQLLKLFQGRLPFRETY